jgi:hypothetical protein
MRVRCSLVLILVFALPAAASADDGRLRVSPEHPRYWEYKGKPVLLLGGSVQDNLFQIPDLEEHLDLLRSVGGNYVRCTMSSRDEGNVWPFHRRDDGRYDLERPGDEYWKRFENLLRLARERDVIVQIELWDRFDFAREPWQQNPYNPKNNVNYTPEESGMETSYSEHPGRNENPFFRSVPELENNERLLRFQQAQLDRLLSIALEHPNVLYCISNETSGRPEWGTYWAKRIRAKAAAADVEVHVTEMWDPWDLSHEMHRHTFDQPDLYSFVDISQNNHQKGQTHWDNMQTQRARIASRPRPMNNVKIYGSDDYRFGNDRDGIERFWRNVIGGCASARFHRPVAGLGLGEKAQANLRSARMLTDAMNLFVCEPRGDLLSDRRPNEAYLTAEPGRQYALYFPDGGSVKLDLSDAGGRLQARWLDIMQSRWTDEETVVGGRTVELKAPEKGHWAVLLTADARAPD